MSYDLRILVHEPVNVHQLFAFCRFVMGIHPDVEIEYDPACTKFTDGVDPNAYPPGTKHLHSKTGGNGPASLDLYYGAEAPLLGNEYHHGEDWEQEREHNGWSAVAIHLSTGVGAAESLHYFVYCIGRAITRLDATWCWEDPQRGETYDGLPDLATVEVGMAGFAESGWLDRRTEAYKDHRQFARLSV